MLFQFEVVLSRLSGSHGIKVPLSCCGSRAIRCLISISSFKGPVALPWQKKRSGCCAKLSKLLGRPALCVWAPGGRLQLLVDLGRIPLVTRHGRPFDWQLQRKAVALLPCSQELRVDLEAKRWINMRKDSA